MLAINIIPKANENAVPQLRLNLPEIVNEIDIINPSTLIKKNDDGNGAFSKSILNSPLSFNQTCL